MNDVAKLPMTGDVGDWTDSQMALMEFAGLVKQGDKVLPAPRPVIEAFAQTVQRTQLDPIARQIYCIERGGRYTIQVSIDGARLVAQRSGDYEGQTPIEWTSDGKEWVEVWLGDESPKAARAGVNRKGFRETLYAVATWDGFAPKTKDGKLMGLWATNLGSHMLGKCAEMLALRKAFPMELSGLYVPEEMEQANAKGNKLDSTKSTAVKGIDWLEEMTKIDNKADLRELYTRIRDHGEMTQNLSKKIQEHAQTLPDNPLIETTEDTEAEEIIETPEDGAIGMLVEDEDGSTNKSK